jgi:hypothetical protein
LVCEEGKGLHPALVHVVDNVLALFGAAVGNDTLHQKATEATATVRRINKQFIRSSRLYFGA